MECATLGTVSKDLGRSKPVAREHSLQGVLWLGGEKRRTQASMSVLGLGNCVITLSNSLTLAHEQFLPAVLYVRNEHRGD